MRAEHLAIDGSLVTIESEVADLSVPVTSTGWAMSPSLLRTHPFTVRPPGYRELVETLAGELPGIRVGAQDEVEVAGGSLRVAVVQQEVPPEGQRITTVGYWEGETGSLSTGLPGEQIALLIEIFETLQIRQTRRGVHVGVPVLATPRPPIVVKAVPRAGVLAIRPAIAGVLEQVPRAAGLRVAHGEVFRSRAEPGARGLLFVGASSVVSVNPSREAESEDVLGMIEDLRVEWRLRAA